MKYTSPQKADLKEFYFTDINDVKAKKEEKKKLPKVISNFTPELFYNHQLKRTLGTKNSVYVVNAVLSHSSFSKMCRLLLLSHLCFLNLKSTL